MSIDKFHALNQYKNFLIRLLSAKYCYRIKIILIDNKRLNIKPKLSGGLEWG